MESKVEYKSSLPFGINSLLRSDQRSEGKQNDTSHSKKRKRCSFSAEQVYRLEVEFQRQRYLSPDTRSKLALMLGLTQQQVKIWFQNRRYKSKPKEETKATNVERSKNIMNEVENRDDLTRPVIVLIRDGCPTFEYFMTVFKHSTRKLNCI